MAVWVRRKSATGELHCDGATGQLIGAQTPVELHEEIADRCVPAAVVVSTLDSENGVDFRRRIRSVAQIHRGQAEVGPVSHWVIDTFEQQNEGIAWHVRFARHYRRRR